MIARFSKWFFADAHPLEWAVALALLTLLGVVIATSVIVG